MMAYANPMCCMTRLQDYNILRLAIKATGTQNTVVFARYLLKHHKGDIVFFSLMCMRG